ncbi:TPA: hypothetical protein ACT5B2_006326 [Burkholderia cenocepacia]|uniref:hypothetical protein n=1 Tax=Burkholderia cenocepacia TaxID=95486 RepID=UPI001B99104D|nr:hypothetical protein [Burkholderia cenocepacia]MBR8140308.1 hypothetical protein [Burkholderia cenocepacia]
MTFVMRTLIVEDDETEIESWNDVIDLHNVDAGEHGFEFNCKIVKTLADAKHAISLENFDAAIVDIRLKLQNGNAAPNTDGNEVLATILDSEMAVVAVFTGEAALAAPPQSARQVVQVFTKGGGEGEGTAAVIEWLKQQATMVKHIQLAQSSIRAEMARIFTKSIWPRWKYWTTENTEFRSVTDAITRHITSHVYASLMEKGQQEAHPEEWYFVPPIREGLRTGDLVRIMNGVVEIVITPRCDLSRDNKNKTIQLASCEDVSVEWKARKERIAVAQAELEKSGAIEGDKVYSKILGKIKDAENSLRQFTQHRNSTNFHFLPEMKLSTGSFGPFMVRFDSIRSVNRDSDEARNILPNSRMAALTPEFLPSLVERLGTYFSRIGTPDYSHPE